MAKTILEVADALDLTSERIKSIVNQAVAQVRHQRSNPKVARIRLDVAKQKQAGLSWNMNHHILSEVSRLFRKDTRVASVGIKTNEVLGKIRSVELILTLS